MASALSIQKAARAWCASATQIIEMDVVLAEEFANILDVERKELMVPKEAINCLSEAFKADPMYAHSWHSNIAVFAQDEGLSHVAANRAASRFMKLAFDIETSADGLLGQAAMDAVMTLEQIAMAATPLPSKTVEAFYANAKEIHEENVKALCESHERLRIELQEAIEKLEYTRGLGDDY